MSEKAWLSAASGRGGYGRPLPEIMLEIEQDALGTQVGARGYTTAGQVQALGRALQLTRGDLLLDLGSGRGWPALRLVRDFGCNAVLTDLPLEGLQTAASRARKEGLLGRVGFARNHASHLPFSPNTFDAVSSTDVFC